MFRRLVTLEEAKQAILSRIKPVPLSAENVPLGEAFDRVLAEDIVAESSVPPFDRSTVDGYAVRAEDTFGADENRPVTLTVCGAVRIGELPKVTVGKKEAVEIATGAPVPKGADAVVMYEQTERKTNLVGIFAALTKHTNMMKAGSDIRKGETVLKSGRLLGSREIGTLAALGTVKVNVHGVPRVAVISTGPEVVELGEDLPPGKIYDTNAYSLSAAVIESGAEPIRLGVFPDDFAELQGALKRGLDSADLVVTSGGVSVGQKDITPRALASLGKPGVVLSGIAIKPGKPTTVGFIRQKPVFALPGHPTSALLVFYLLVRPAIKLKAGRSMEEEPTIKAVTTARMFSAKGRKTFVMVTLKRDKSEKILAEPVLGGDSGAITTVGKADGFVELPENVQFVDAGEEVVVNLFRPKMRRL